MEGYLPEQEANLMMNISGDKENFLNFLYLLSRQTLKIHIELTKTREKRDANLILCSFRGGL